MKIRVGLFLCILVVCSATSLRADDADDLADRDPSVRAKAAQALGKG